MPNNRIFENLQTLADYREFAGLTSIPITEPLISRHTQPTQITQDGELTSQNTVSQTNPDLKIVLP